VFIFYMLLCWVLCGNFGWSLP